MRRARLRLPGGAEFLGEGRLLRKLIGIAEQIEAIEDEFVAKSDAELRAMTDEFKERLAEGETLDEILAEAFATVREAARRTLRRLGARRVPTQQAPVVFSPEIARSIRSGPAT